MDGSHDLGALFLCEYVGHGRSVACFWGLVSRVTQGAKARGSQGVFFGFQAGISLPADRSYALIGRRVGGTTARVPGGLQLADDRSAEHPSPQNIMKILDIPQSGKIGTDVSVRTRFGQTRRKLTVQNDPKTPNQIRVRSLLGRIAARWRTLTDQQRALWILAASLIQSRRRMNQSGALLGHQLFTKINFNLVIAGQSQVDVPTERPQFDPNPVGEITITNNGGEIRLKLRVSATPTQPIVVLGYPPMSAGAMFARDFVILGLLPAAVDGFSDITDLYVARYGVPPVGKRLLIRTRAQVNGWEDIPLQTTGIVPAA
jgi:hypothetical protein